MTEPQVLALGLARPEDIAVVEGRVTVYHERVNVGTRLATLAYVCERGRHRIQAIGLDPATGDPLGLQRQQPTLFVGGPQEGTGPYHLRNPRGICVTTEEEKEEARPPLLFIADSGNHRVVEWRHGEFEGRVVAGGNGPGDGYHQLNNPVRLALTADKDAILICDEKNRRVVKWPRGGAASASTGVPFITGIWSPWGLCLVPRAEKWLVCDATQLVMFPITGGVKKEVGTLLLGDRQGGQFGGPDKLSHTTSVAFYEDEDSLLIADNRYRIQCLRNASTPRAQIPQSLEVSLVPYRTAFEVLSEATTLLTLDDLSAVAVHKGNLYFTAGGCVSRVSMGALLAEPETGV
eukprot:TRINITY_DN41724_c0_g1_i1.p1 TRINITY_DN41724_c0_g1~~TRINITY_DN41724_c0_g1_i1.p1  ORF type:complete len:348 (+),score=48.99 TRINITY_DN41724_c0_g1_i1:50-1093(+)